MLTIRRDPESINHDFSGEVYAVFYARFAFVISTALPPVFLVVVLIKNRETIASTSFFKFGQGLVNKSKSLLCKSNVEEDREGGEIDLTNDQVV